MVNRRWAYRELFDRCGARRGREQCLLLPGRQPRASARSCAVLLRAGRAGMPQGTHPTPHPPPGCRRACSLCRGCSEEEAARAYDRALWRLKPKEAHSYVNFKDEVPPEVAHLLAAGEAGGGEAGGGRGGGRGGMQRVAGARHRVSTGLWWGRRMEGVAAFWSRAEGSHRVHVALSKARPVCRPAVDLGTGPSSSQKLPRPWSAARLLLPAELGAGQQRGGGGGAQRRQRGTERRGGQRRYPCMDCPRHQPVWAPPARPRCRGGSGSGSIGIPGAWRPCLGACGAHAVGAARQHGSRGLRPQPSWQQHGGAACSGSGSGSSRHRAVARQRLCGNAWRRPAAAVWRGQQRHGHGGWRGCRPAADADAGRCAYDHACRRRRRPCAAPHGAGGQRDAPHPPPAAAAACGGGAQRPWRRPKGPGTLHLAGQAHEPHPERAHLCM